MSQLNYQNPKQPTDIVQRRPSDALWFTVLVASIGVGLGMTIFAPVGDEPPATAAMPITSTTAPMTTAPSTTAPMATEPTTTPAPNTAPQPATSPTL